MGAIITLFQQHLGWLVSALIQITCFDDTESVAEVVLLPLFKDWEYDGASHLVVTELFS